MQEMQETRVQSLGWKDPLEREWLPTPVFLQRKFHRQRNLVGYSSSSHKELDTTECVHTHTRARVCTHTHTHTHSLKALENWDLISKV